MNNAKTRLEMKISIPSYTLAEELMNSISHGIGGALGIAALVLCVVKAALYGNAVSVAAVSIYGATLVILYTVSSIYHALRPNMAKRIFRVLDHCSIYLLIAGTYTPYTLISLRGTLGWVLFGVVWGAAALGIACNSIDIKKFRVLSFINYIASGWVVVIAAAPLAAAIGGAGSFLLLAGGIVYTVGALFYLLGKACPFMHSTFHIFVLAGSILHFFSILLYVI